MAGRPPKYPWTDWFERLERGSVVGVAAGRDFDHDPKHMRQQILLEARRRGVVVRTTWRPRAQRFDIEQSRRSAIFPWDSWFDGGVHRLLPGIDFQHKELADMAQLVRQAGRRRGLLVRTTIKDGSLVLQAFKREA